ncbi:MAG: PD-(D/E)XK nuclease family protein [Prevotella sp.]|jgi:hypothetical protein|nr:PD-(D/E)XK nuclease family protein [Prevotella sp.]
MMNNVDFLLKQVNFLRLKLLERQDNEEAFNLFSILLNERNEVNLHSRFISVLLDPKAPHKMGSTFLSLFLRKLESNMQVDDNEVLISPNFHNPSEFKDIDIFIRKGNDSAVIIENKIDASDSNHEGEGQLEKYYREAIEEGYSKDNIDIYYLTLDQHEPSEESVSTSGKYPELAEKVQCISYGSEIIEWLNECAKESYAKPILRESINQYINLLQKMTNNESSVSERIELMNIVGKNTDNLESAMFLIKNFKHIQWHTIFDFWKELSDALGLAGYKLTESIDKEMIDNAVHGGPRKRQIDFNLMFTSKSGIPLGINCDYADYICYGVSDTSGKYTKDIKRKVKALEAMEEPDGSNESWLYWNYFEPESGGDLEFCFSNFEGTPTYKLISPQSRKEYIERMVSIVNEFVHKLEAL